MNYRRLGQSGVKISEIGFGTWLTFGNVTSQEAAQKCIEAAIDAGINFFDTADVYAGGEAEVVLGKTLLPLNRAHQFIATKLFFPMSESPNDRGLSRKHIMESAHASLNRLDTDYIDLYQCHRFDEATPLEETVRAMDDLVRAGKILYWGVSQWSAQQIMDMMKIVEQTHAARPISNQPVYNLIVRDIEAEVMPTCARVGLGLVCYSPLAQGVLTGKYRSTTVLPQDSRAVDERQNQFIKRFITEETLKKAARVAALANKIRITPAALALAWCLRRSEVSSVIIGASRPAQVTENARASGIKLSEDVVKEIEGILTGM
jgi:voltage-dependent potassium channel beta subunit